MSVKNQASYASRRADRSVRNRAMLKGVAILLGMMILSFLFGFMIISKLIVGKPDKETASERTQVAAPNANAGTAPPASDRRSAPTPNAGATGGGPILAPAESAATPSAAPERDKPETDAPKPSLEGETNRTETGQPATSQPNEELDSQEPVQRPSSLDNPRRAAASEETPPESEPTAGKGLVRVQVGVYSTRRSADQEVRRLGDLGVKAYVATMQREGKTLYRVQTGVYRVRANAEAERKKLSEAGVEATVLPVQ